MRRLLAAFLITAVLGAPKARAAEALTADMSWETVYATSVEAMGGSRAVAEVHSIKGTARSVSPQGEVSTHTQSARGAMFFFQQAHPSGPAFQAYLIPGQPIFMDNRKGAPTPLQPEAVAGIRAHDFQMIPLDFAARFPDATVAGMEEFSGAPCLVVDFRDELGAPGRAFYNTASALLAGYELRDPIHPGGTVRVRILDWRVVNGVKLPSLTLMNDSSGDTVFRFTELTTSGIPDEEFPTPKQ